MNHPSVYKTQGGFFRPGKTQGGERRNSSTGRGFGAATTNPGTSVDEAMANRDAGANSPYMKSPLPGSNVVRFGPGKHAHDAGMMGSTDTLPKLAAVRTAGHSAAK